jgi:hypothetical protein
VVGCCEGNESSCSIGGGEFFDQLSKLSVVKVNCLVATHVLDLFV